MNTAHKNTPLKLTSFVVAFTLFLGFGFSSPVFAAQEYPPSHTIPNQGDPADDTKIEIRGSGEFVSQTRAAINFLATCDPDALSVADTYITTILEYNRSGMGVNDGTFMASNTTAFAPRYSRSLQVFWYAGTIVHDARHRWQAENGILTDWAQLSEEERDAIELDARDVQVATLQKCLSSVPQKDRPQAEFMLQYLNNMQSPTTDCDYCEKEYQDRTW